MSACAMLSGFAVGVLSATDVDASACRACSPSGVRLAVRWERRVVSAGWSETYHCERGLSYSARRSYLVEFFESFAF